MCRRTRELGQQHPQADQDREVHEEHAERGIRQSPPHPAGGRADPALEEALRTDVAAGKRPCCVVPSLGTTSTSSIDPVALVIEKARPYNAWIHVDGAYGGPAAILPEMRWMTEQASGAHSVVVNPHKWMFTPIDCSVFYTSHPEVLRRALALTPEYLKTALQSFCPAVT